MFKVTGTVVGYDDFLPPRERIEKHEFHIVVELERTGRRMRLRGPSTISMPLRLEHFGAGADLAEVRDRLMLGARLTFEYMEVWRDHLTDPDYHWSDVIVMHPSEIVRDSTASLTRGKIYYFPARAAVRA